MLALLVSSRRRMSAPISRNLSHLKGRVKHPTKYRSYVGALSFKKLRKKTFRLLQATITPDCRRDFSPPGDAVAWCLLRNEVVFIGVVSWESSAPRSLAPASLHLWSLHLKPNLPSLRAPERPLFTHPPFWFESR